MGGGEKKCKQKCQGTDTTSYPETTVLEGSPKKVLTGPQETLNKEYRKVYRPLPKPQTPNAGTEVDREARARCEKNAKMQWQASDLKIIKPEVSKQEHN